ncbi:MAG: hypothetical protein Q7S93_02040 [Phenylobacterium sp.]|nr:hypothetical protein [Phenylobacterium sp.]MDO8408833.1 hypothetical protein [Phenylobacterium sp.]
MAQTANNTTPHQSEPRRRRDWTAFESLAFVAASSALLWIAIIHLAQAA